MRKSERLANAVAREEPRTQVAVIRRVIRGLVRRIDSRVSFRPDHNPVGALDWITLQDDTARFLDWLAGAPAGIERKGRR
jgi:hypothetical protein